MPERDDQPAGVEEEDFLDDDLDLDVDELSEAELPDAGPGEPEAIDDEAADALIAEELELSNGHAPLELLEPETVAEPEVFEDDDLPEELAEPGFAAPAAVVEAAVSPDLEARITKLEAAARALAAAEVTRDQKKVRRKVSAATTGAGAVGAVPIILQLAGAFDLDPELVATASTVLAALGAFVAGWLTPERKPSIPTPVALDTLSRPS